MDTMASRKCIRSFILFILVISLLTSFPSIVFPNAEETNWVPGPTTVDLGNNLAEIAIGESYVFANAEETKAVMEKMGNPPSGRELGLIIPRVDPPSWFLVFEYFPVGYIRDDDRNKIDSKAILASIKNGNEKANEFRREKGIPPLKIVGWYQEPNYDVNTNNLVWTLLCEESGGQQIVNYNVRLLGRKGYMSVVLVTEPEILDTSRAELNSVLSNFTYKKGKRYAEFVQGDRVAKIGLTALAAGGAATVAAKSGALKVLAKFAKVLAFAVFAILAGLRKRITSIFKKKKSAQIGDTTRFNSNEEQLA
jgi:uncharacterized membrane-anchored protein